MVYSPLLFNTQLGQQKPESIINKIPNVPSATGKNLTGILAEKGPFLLIKNKYPVLKDTFQTVLIETLDCNGDLSNYPKDYLHDLISFGVEKWLEMENYPEYRSVLFFKNHGPKSGGSIFHPHMQIVGLKNIDYRQSLTWDFFEGLVINEKNQVQLNISTKPRVGFYEFNIILNDLKNLDQMADYIQITVHYLLNHFSKNCDSYNIFFYHFEDHIIAKIMPRFITSPIFIGYAIPQVSNLAEEIVAKVKELYHLL